MPDRPFSGFGGGKGVLGLGPATNTFGIATTADRAAAEVIRDAYAAANADWLAEYNGKLSFWIRLVWDDGVVEQRRNAAGNAWEDVTNVIRGKIGPQGKVGVADDAAIDLRIASPARAVNPSGTFDDVRLPAGIMRDAELTASAVRALLGLSAAEANDLLTGASINGRVITFEQNDGSQVAITIPAGTGTGAEIVTELSGLSGAARLPASAVKDLPSGSGDAIVDLGLATISASGFTTAAPGGRTTKYPSGTILLFEVNNPYSVTPTDDVGGFTIGVVKYDFYKEGASNVTRGEFEVDTSYMCVVSPHGHIQLNSPYRRVATTTGKGLLSGADKAKLDGIETAATADQTGPEIKVLYEGEDNTNAFTDALKAKLAGIATAATAVSVIDVLAKIFAGTGININKATAGQVTISATGAGSGGTADGVVRTGAFDEATQIVTLTTSLGGTVTINLGAFVTATELTTALDLKASLLGATFTGAVKGIDPAADKDFVTLSYFNTHKNVSPVADDIYLGTSEDAVATGPELTIAAVAGVGTILAYAGNKHQLIARLATEADITTVFYSDDPTNLNAIGVFTKQVAKVTPTGEAAGTLFNVWVSDQALINRADVTLRVA